MTHLEVSRTITDTKAIAPPQPRNLLDVRNALVSIKLPPKQKSDLISALNTLGKQELREGESNPDVALERLLVDARSLTPKLDQRVGARLGFVRASWSNIAWRVRKALKLTGAWELFADRRIQMSEPWRRIAQQSPPYSYIRLLGRWASGRALGPEAIDDTHMPAYLEWLSSWKPDQYARCYYESLRAFNKVMPCRAPLAIVTRRSGHYSIPMSSWDPALVADVDHIMQKFRDPDIDADELFEPLVEGTVKSYRSRVFRTLSAYVVAKGLDPFSVKSASELLQPEAAKLALDYMLSWTRRRKPDAYRTSDIHGSAKLIALIAERCYRDSLPAEIILELQNMARRRAPVRNGMNPKNRELLRLFDDEKLTARFLHLPYALCDRVLKRGELRHADAVKIKVAFAIAQSCEAPLRPENQAGLIMRRHVFTFKHGQQESLAIRVPAGEVKNAVDLDFEMAGKLVDLYHVYVTRARPLLCTTANPFLYPGRGSARQSRSGLSQQIARVLEYELGVRLTGRQFRHVIGYLYLKSHPGEYEVVRQLLGHKDITTTMGFYAAMEMRSASKLVSSFVARRREELAPLIRGRRKRAKRLGSDPAPDRSNV